MSDDAASEDRGQEGELDLAASSDAPTTVTPRSGMSTPVATPEEDNAERAARQARLNKKDLPAKLGRYMLVERLGVGGMAEVFKASQDGPAGFQKTVVVKRILPHLAVDPRFVDMFFREAKIAADLSHPNIIQIHELGEDDGTYFIVMEYLQGLSLFQIARRAWRAERSLPMELAVYAVADAAQGLFYAYDKVDDDGNRLNLIHRDISPDNLMITSQAVTKVLDFGIAKAANTENLTKTGEMKGKIPYMPRELLEPDGVVDHRSDLYALGVSLYWLLTGQRPFQGTTDLQVMQAIVAGDPVRPTRINASIPRALEEITLALIHRDMDMRPSSGRKVANELLGLVSAQREQVARFVREVMALDPMGPGEAPRTTSGFLPAVPITGTLAAAQHRKPDPETLGLEVDFDDIRASVAEDVPASMPLPPVRPAMATGERTPTPAQSGDPPPAPERGTVDDVAAPALPEASSSAFDALLASEAEADAAPRRRPLGLMLGVLGAAVLCAVGAVFALTDGDEPADAVTEVAAGQGTGEVAPSEDQVADAPPMEAVKADDSVEDPPEHVDDAEPAQAAEDPAVPADVAPEKPRRAPPRAARAVKRAPKKPDMLEVKAKAPRFIRWLSSRGETLGSGNATLKVPADARSVIALDGRRQVRSPARIAGGKVTYGDIEEGTLVLRVFPHAEMVALGGDKLGPAPLKPQKLKVGTYTVAVTKGKKTEKQTFTIEAGRTAVVKVIFKD